MLELAGILDEYLKIHFLNSTACRGTSKTTQNVFLYCIHEVHHNEICAEIKQPQFSSVMLADTSGVSDLM